MREVPQSEQTIHVAITPQEMIALELAILFFQRYGRAISPAYEQAVPLLQQYQRRLQEQTRPTPDRKPS